MAGTEQDNPSGEPKRPTVRLKTLPNRTTEPPPVTPIIPPDPQGRPELRLRRITPKPPAVEERPEPITPAPVEAEPAVPQGVTPPPAEAGAADAVPAAPHPASESPSGGGVRLRRLAKPAASATPAVSVPPAAPCAPASTAPAASSAPAPAGATARRYTPDPSAENAYRRQWWKYDLRVRSKRIAPVEEKTQQ